MQKQSCRQNLNIVFESMERGVSTLRYDEVPVSLPKDNPPYLHYHNKLEIGICTQGLGIFYGSNFAESLHTGDIVIFAPGRAHYSQSIGNKECMCRFAYIDQTSLLESIFTKNNINIDIADYDLPAVIRPHENKEIYRILKSLLEDLFSQSAINPELLCGVHLMELMLKISTIFCARDKQDDMAAKDKPIAQVEKYISSHYFEDVNTNTLCSICFLSESQLRRRFKAAYGTSPMQYMKLLRGKIGAELLLQTELSVAEISEKVGYNDVSVFYRHFTSINGAAPSEYRKTSR